jgi:hypothetical protein
VNFKVIQTLQEMKTVQAYWEKWQNHANNDYAQYNLICNLRPEIEAPFIIVIEKENQIIALLIGRLERTYFKPAIGYYKPVSVSAKVITIIHQGTLGQWDEDISRKTVHFIWSLISSGFADAIEFHHLSEESPLLGALRNECSPWFCEKKPRWSTHWEMSIPAEGKFIENKMRSKHRSEIRKMQRELESTFSGKINWYWMRSFDDILGLCSRLEEVAAVTYQRGLGSGFIDSDEYRQRLELFAHRGLLRVQLLEIDGKVRAFWFGTICQDVFYLSETGYDPDFRKYEIGTLSLIRMLDELALEGILTLDFSLGDAHYKKRFGDRSWRETVLWLFAPTMKGFVLRVMLWFSVMLDCAARQVLIKMKLTDKLKSLLRGRMEMKN